MMDVTFRISSSIIGFHLSGYQSFFRSMSTAELEQTAALLHAAKVDIRIPETCIFRNGDCQGLYWYHLGDSTICFDGQWPHVSSENQSRMFTTKKVNEKSAKCEYVIQHFMKEIKPKTTGPSSDGTSLAAVPVAISMSVSPPKLCRMDNFDSTGALDVEIEYLTSRQLEEYVRHISESNGNAVIMKYVAPSNGFHNMVRVIFTPYMLKVEKHESIFLVNDEVVPLKKRMCTSYADGKALFNNCEVSENLENRALGIRQALFHYFKERDCCIDNAIMYFTEVGNDLVLQWIGKLELKLWHDVKLQQVLKEPVQQQSTLSISAGRSNTRKLRQSLEHEFADANSRQKRPKRSGIAPPPTSPGHEHLADMEEEALVQDFGFYSGDPERIKTIFKKNIRSITRVANPTSMALDDTPPYDDNFIRALIDPKFGQVYFGLQEQKSMSRRVSRRPSLTNRVTRAGLNNAVDSLNQVLNWRLPRKRNPDDPSEASTTFRSRSMIAPSNSESVSFLILDQELRNLLDEAGETIAGVNESGANSAVKALQDAIPDPRHLGHIQAIRHKYGFREFADEEDDASFKQLVRETRAAKAAKPEKLQKEVRKASISVTHSSDPSPTRTERSERPSSVNSTKTSKRAASGLREYNRTPANVVREKEWIGISGTDNHGPAVPKPHRDPPPPSAAQTRLLRQKIDGFESKLKDVSLMNYLVDTEQFEWRRPPTPLRVPREDMVEDWRSRLHFTASIPDAPVVELTNTHMSLSEEMLQSRRKAGGKTSRDLLEMLFGEVDDSGETEVYPDDAASTELAPAPLAQRKKSFSSLEASRLLRREESNIRFTNLTKHGVADSREKILLIVGTFEDMIYQWSSSLRGPFSSRSRVNTIKLYIPPSIYHLRLELRSLLLILGFSEKSVETKTVPTIEAQFQENDMDVPTIVKEYSAEFNAAIAARMLASAQQLVNDVADFYRQNDWDTIAKIRSMTEDGFTFVDAITSRRPGLARRASVSSRAVGFSDLTV